MRSGDVSTMGASSLAAFHRAFPGPHQKHREKTAPSFFPARLRSRARGKDRKMATTEQQAEPGAKNSIWTRDIWSRDTGRVLSGIGSVLFVILTVFHLFLKDAIKEKIEERRAKEKAKIQERQRSEQYAADAAINGKNLIAWIKNDKSSKASLTRDDASALFAGKMVMLQGMVRAIGRSTTSEEVVVLLFLQINLPMNFLV